MYGFDQLSRRGLFRMGFTLAVASLAGRLHTVVLEPKMQKTKGTQSRNQSEQDNQSKVGQQRHEGSAEVGGEALNVNENDVRDQNRPGTEAVKGGKQSGADNKN
jgi:hypothetical protein